MMNLLRKHKRKVRGNRFIRILLKSLKRGRGDRLRSPSRIKRDPTSQITSPETKVKRTIIKLTNQSKNIRNYRLKISS
jgi:hypothetical protein